jgi:phenol/toluene 2-monooxygenase (NADH) P5/A5
MHQLKIEPIGEKVPVAERQTILDACLRAGIWLPHACGHGLCGTCKISVIEGEIDHGAASSFALMDFERDEGRALACSATLCSDAVIEADIDEDPDARHYSVRDLVGRVALAKKLTPDIRGIWIELEGDGIEFQAGQYINLEIPGVPGRRAFSLANPPTDPTRLELHVRHVPGGKATTWLHEDLNIGDRLAFSGPYGRFFVRKSASQPMIFLAGGSGLSSPKAMILDLLAEDCRTPIVLVHGVRGHKDLYFADLFRELAERHRNFSYVPALSAPDEGDAWDGEVGFVHEVAQRHFAGRFAGHKAYLCGPPLMIEGCINVLMKGRLFERDIYTEKFATAADGASSLARSPLFKRI